MPALPEFRNAFGKIRPVKIIYQPKAQDLGDPDGDVRIAGEIAIDLEREKYRGQNERPARVIVRVVINRVHINGQPVRDDHFFK